MYSVIYRNIYICISISISLSISISISISTNNISYSVYIGFPCNQFGKQEPGTNEEIKTFIKTEFGITFPVFDKVEVNGSVSSTTTSLFFLLLYPCHYIRYLSLQIDHWTIWLTIYLYLFIPLYLYTSRMPIPYFSSSDPD